MVLEWDNPFTFDDYDDCMELCLFDAKTCNKLCSNFEELEEGD